MLNWLVESQRVKYDFFFSTISKENPRAFHAHAKDGWQVVGEDEDTFHAILDLKKGY